MSGDPPLPESQIETIYLYTIGGDGRAPGGFARALFPPPPRRFAIFLGMKAGSTFAEHALEGGKTTSDIHS
jgi:hypothetical protein